MMGARCGTIATENPITFVFSFPLQNIHQSSNYVEKRKGKWNTLNFLYRKKNFLKKKKGGGDEIYNIESL